MKMTPSPSIAGRTITETLGLVRGNTIRARHVGNRRDRKRTLFHLVCDG